MEYFLIKPGNLKELKNRFIKVIKNANEKILLAAGFLNDEEIIKSFKCPNCFIKETQRSLFTHFWHPDMPIPDYL
ncbi:hypothetical protein [Peribacillus frigoritolerans]|uniref:hypothetical protein n=1 Tax=Peribacillus frigoritolerans TaxID=450367 RepID=UPI002EAB06A0|nr:hypothetical protein [Peribacillus frigoritolerans]